MEGPGHQSQDESINSHAHPSGPDTSSCQCDDKSELLEIIGALRGATMLDDEDDISAEGDSDEEIDEIQEITAWEHFI